MASVPEDLCCPACHDIFRDPVLLSCSHSFCKGCLQSWWGIKLPHDCPVCRAPSDRSDPPCNLALKNLCLAFLHERDRKASLGLEALCRVHSEKLKLFCLDHQQPICVVCRDANVHCGHRFKPIEEAAQDHRGELQNALKALQDRMKAFSEVQVNFNLTADHIKLQFQNTERQIREEFRRFHHFLQEEEEARMAALREEEEEKTQMMKMKLDNLSRNMSALSDTVSVALELLQADDLPLLQRYGRVQLQPVMEVPQLGWGSLIEVTKHLGNLTFNIWNKMKDMVSYTPVVLDPNTANAELVLSEDLMSVRFGKRQSVPENPERFEYWDSVLGSGFISGSHSWDVEVKDNKDWEVGILAESVCRQGFAGSTVWSVGFSDAGYRAYSPTEKYVSLPVAEVERIRLHLDWDRGELSFLQLDTDTPLHTFTHTFTEKLYPYLCSRDGPPLKVLPLNVSVTVEQNG